MIKNTIDTNKNTLAEALATYRQMKDTAKKQEETLIGDVLKTIADSDRPMSAKEVSQKLKGAINPRQIAGNLRQVPGQYCSRKTSRYSTINHETRRLNATRVNYQRRMVEVDENGQPIDGSILVQNLTKTGYYFKKN